MSTEDLQKKRGWLNKSEMAASLGISPQAFDKWGVEPAAKIGREVFYTAQAVLQNRLPFATFALARIASKIGSKLETVCKTVRSQIPDTPPLVLEAFEREIALARNLAVEFAEDLPEILDEYSATLDE
nr:DNA-packaging protein [Pseudomonas aeruginosa]